MKDLERRSYVGLLKFSLALVLFIFLPAWTLTYWQGWLYLGVFASSLLFITNYFLKHDPELMERRLHVGPSAEKEKTQKIIQIITSILFIAVYIISSLEHRFFSPELSLQVILFANVMVALGLFIIFLVFKENTFTSAIVETDSKQKVITTGPYKIVRHPMYAGAVLLFLFTPLALDSYWGIGIGILMTLMLVLRLLDEEKLLRKNLKDYTEYCKKTPYRLVPFIY